MHTLKKVIGSISILFIGMQFIQPAHNSNGQVLDTDISRLVPVPDSVHSLLNAACYDCHSNNTRYPWYSNIQPMGWLMASHIKNGKAMFNWSEFGSNSRRKQISKMTDALHSIQDNSMPLSSYALLHEEAKLSAEQKLMLGSWMQQIIDSLSSEN